MARAVVARRHGDDFQARLFWLKAASLLDPDSPVVRVAYEIGPKSFDDITVEYESGRGPRDRYGNPICREHIQCKWHTTTGSFGYAALADPAFLNAQSHSLLQRAHHAQIQFAPHGTGSRFKLVTNWRISGDDPLQRLVRTESGALDLQRLFDDTTDRSRMGKVRKLWRTHLRLDDDGLRLVAGTLSIAPVSHHLVDLREWLNDRCAAAGLKRVLVSDTGFPYDDLIFKLLGQGRAEFDRDSFARMAREEGILDDRPPLASVPAVGVRSFIHPYDNLEERCRPVLDLASYFDGRYFRDPRDWQAHIYPALQAFVADAARSTDQLRLVLDAHVSLAFGTGALLNVKSGKRVEIEQRTGGRRFWSTDDAPADPRWPGLMIEGQQFDTGGDEIAIAVGLTHDVSPAVSAFVRANLRRVGHVVHCRPQDGPSQQSVRCGRHAWMLTETVVQHLLSLRSGGNRASPVHIFIAGPNGFAFFLGQQQQAIGPAAIYEWDFEGQRGGGYSLGLSVGMRVRDERR